MTQTALAPETTVERNSSRFIRYILLGAMILFIGGYLFAWYSANRLTQIYFADAEASFGEGDYMDALMGYDEFNKETQRNEFRGGYAQVVNIWADPYAAPVPGEVEQARARIETIINEHLTIPEAENFVQRNIGRSNPYLGRIYLRLGELYEAEGDIDTAEEIYEDVIDSFSSDTALVERAQQNLERVQQADEG